MRKLTGEKILNGSRVFLFKTKHIVFVLNIELNSVADYELNSILKLLFSMS